MKEYEWESETGMGDVALLLGWTPPPTDDGFWFREDHGPTHDSDCACTESRNRRIKQGSTMKIKKRKQADFSNESTKARVAKLRELQIQQADVPTDREPTLEEELRCNKQIEIATRQIREAQAAGLLMLPKNYVSQGYYEPQIKEYRKVTRNNLPLYS